MNGEKIVIRILDKFNYNFTLEDLYLSEENKRIFYKAINQNNGIILVNGPTGSGKTSTSQPAGTPTTQGKHARQNPKQ